MCFWIDWRIHNIHTIFAEPVGLFIAGVQSMDAYDFEFAQIGDRSMS